MEQKTDKNQKHVQRFSLSFSQELSKSMQSLVDNVYAPLKDITYHLPSISIPIPQSLYKAISGLALQWEETLKSIKSIEPVIKRLSEAEAAEEAFQECGLWFAPSMSGLNDKIVSLCSEGKDQIISCTIASYYRKNKHSILKKAVNSWGRNSFFQPRMKIINDALEAHIEGKFTLSIPALLPLIEGIAADAVKKHALPKIDGPLVFRRDNQGKDGKPTSASRVFATIPITSLTLEELVAVESLLYFLEGTLYVDVSRQKGTQGKRTSPKLNRHLILHGIRTDYATYMNSLRCFMALDVLSLINEQEG